MIPTTPAPEPVAIEIKRLEASMKRWDAMPVFEVDSHEYQATLKRLVELRALPPPAPAAARARLADKVVSDPQSLADALADDSRVPASEVLRGIPEATEEMLGQYATMEDLEQQYLLWKHFHDCDLIGRSEGKSAAINAMTMICLLAASRRERDKLQAFKDWTHAYLDAQGVPHHPPGSHGAEGCRIGDRMDWFVAALAQARQRVDELEAEVKRLREKFDPCQGDEICVCEKCQPPLPIMTHGPSCDCGTCTRKNKEWAE